MLRPSNEPSLRLRELATLVSAGLPLHQSLQQIGLPAPDRHADWTQTLLDARLCDATEQAILRAAWEVGRLEQALNALAARLETQRKYQGQFKARMALPLGVLLLAVLLAPLPELAAGFLGFGGYLQRTLVPIVAAVLFHRVARAAWRHPDTRRYLNRVLPGRGHRAALTDALDVLALGQASGVPLAHGFVLAARGCTRRNLSEALNRAAHALARGEPLAEQLHTLPGLDEVDHGLLTTGEQAGRLEDMLERVVLRHRDADLARLKLGAEWLPRLVYMAVAAWIIPHLF